MRLFSSRISLRCAAWHSLPGGEGALFDELPGDLVGTGRVDADEVTRRALGDFPTVWQLALGVVGCGVPDPGARQGAAGHGTGIGAVDGDHLAVVERDIGQKALVAGDQLPGLQGDRRSWGELLAVRVLTRARRGQQASGS